MMCLELFSTSYNTVFHYYYVLLVFQALALLIDYLNKEDTTILIGAILGLGIAYAGSQKDEVDLKKGSYQCFLLFML